MVVTYHEIYAPQSTPFKSEQKVFPTRRTLPVGHFHAEHLAPAFPIDSDGYEHCSGSDHGVLPHFLIPRVQDQIGIFTVKLSAAKAPQFLVELLIEAAYRTRAKTVSAELFADCFDLPRRYALDVHLGERSHQRLFAALIAFENLGGKPSVAVLGNSQLELSHPRNQVARVVAASIARAPFDSFSLLRPDCFAHFGLQELLDHRAHNRTQKLAVFGHHRFDLSGRPVILLSGHGSIFSWLFHAPNCLP